MFCGSAILSEQRDATVSEDTVDGRLEDKAATAAPHQQPSCTHHWATTGRPSSAEVRSCIVYVSRWRNRIFSTTWRIPISHYDNYCSSQWRSPQWLRQAWRALCKQSRRPSVLNRAQLHLY